MAGRDQAISAASVTKVLGTAEGGGRPAAAARPLIRKATLFEENAAAYCGL
jgi:hypothetical protein